MGIDGHYTTYWKGKGAWVGVCMPEAAHALSLPLSLSLCMCQGLGGRWVRAVLDCEISCGLGLVSR